MADLRDLVRQRAGNRCEYCCKLEVFGNYPHHLEHIIARKHGGLSEIANLAWACFQCNVAKGTDIASIDPETKDLAPLFNPRTQDWNDHFELVGATIVGRTAVGRVTARLLQMNHPKQVEVRRLLISAGAW